MKALQLFAGPKARAHVAENGLMADHIGAVAAAAGGPKGLVLGRIDQFVFGEWLAASSQQVQLVGASIGAWRMATACCPNTMHKFKQLEHDYIRQHYELEPGKKYPTPQHISERFGHGLQAFYDGLVPGLLAHPRYGLHVITSLGLGPLQSAKRPGSIRMALGFGGAYLANAYSRKAMGRWLQRVVFSSPAAGLPFADDGYNTARAVLNERNFADALQASCSIPMVLQAVGNIADAPRGWHWDGGLSDYHLHLDWRRLMDDSSSKLIATNPMNTWAPGQFDPKKAPLVLYPHFQQAVVPGWFDKAFKRRHASTPFLDNMLLLAPRPEWIASLPRGKLPDRSDFAHFGTDLAARVACWQQAADLSQQLADEFAQWLANPNPADIQVL